MRRSLLFIESLAYLTVRIWEALLLSDWEGRAALLAGPCCDNPQSYLNCLLRAQSIWSLCVITCSVVVPIASLLTCPFCWLEYSIDLDVCFLDNCHFECPACVRRTVWLRCQDPQNVGSRWQACGQATSPSDPNEKLGPTGFGPQALTGTAHPWLYTVDFENVPTASAAAQRIMVTDQLDPSLDPRTPPPERDRLREVPHHGARQPLLLSGAAAASARISGT